MRAYGAGRKFIAEAQREPWPEDFDAQCRRERDDYDHELNRRMALAPAEREAEDELKWRADFEKERGEPYTEEAFERWAVEQDAAMDREAAAMEAEWRRLSPSERDRRRQAERERQDFRREMLGMPERSESGAIRLLTPTHCASQRGRRYVIKGLLAERDLACVFGPPGAGKSIVVPHWCYAVAQGRSAFGLRTKKGLAFYIAAEDTHGMGQRVRALKLIHGNADNFRVVQGISDLRAPDQLHDFLQLIAKHRPRIIVLDTVALGFPGIDENASADMSKVVSTARKFNAQGAAVVLIHHDTKAGTGTPRGHSILNGALDMALHLTRDDATKIVTGRLTKNRNGPCDLTIAFQIRGERIGVDEDGDPITAPIAVELTAADLRPAGNKLPGTAKAAMHVLQSLLTDGVRTPDGHWGVLESAWRAACEDQRISTADDPDSRAKAFRRAYKELLAKKVVAAGSGYVWIAVPATRDFESPAARTDGHGQTPDMSGLSKRQDPDRQDTRL